MPTEKPTEKTYKVRINPDRKVDGKPITVRHPETSRPFPADEFSMSEADYKNSRVRRLFAKPSESGGLAGGVMGDLQFVDTLVKKTLVKTVGAKTSS